MSSWILFECADTTFALRATAVLRILRMAAVAPVPGAAPHLRGVLNLHGDLLPVVDVRARLGHPPRPPRPGDQLLVVHAGERRLALEVERVLGILEAGEPDPRATGDASLAAGAVALPDGAVVVQDPAAWLREADAAAASDGAGTARGDADLAPGGRVA